MASQASNRTGNKSFGCPIQAVLWLEWATMPTPLVCHSERTPDYLYAAPLNGGRNYNGPKVAKFQSGLSSDLHEWRIAKQSVAQCEPATVHIGRDRCRTAFTIREGHITIRPHQINSIPPQARPGRLRTPGKNMQR